MLASEFDLNALQYILETCSGVAEEVDWKAAGTLELTFSEIGYDSIALLEIVARIQRDYGVRIPDEAIGDLRTPHVVLRYVNQLIADT